MVPGISWQIGRHPAAPQPATVPDPGAMGIDPLFQSRRLGALTGGPIPSLSRPG